MFNAHPALKRALRGALALLLVAFAAAAAAQPATGSVHRDLIALGSGSSVALPEGSWEVTRSGSYNSLSNIPWQILTLKNQAQDAAIPYLVVRSSATSNRWGNTACQNARSSHFMLNEHGTRSSEIMNKCSRFLATGDVKAWIENLAQSPDPGTRIWWQEAAPGMQDLRERPGVSVILAELRVQVFNQRAIQVEAVLYPPRGVRAPEFRQRFLDGRPDPEHDILANWASIYIESMQKTYFDKKPQAVMPVAYTPNLQRRAGATMVASAPPAAGQAAPASPVVVAAAPTPATAPAPVLINPPAPSVVAAAPAPAPAAAPAATPAPDTRAERQRLEAERRALEQERQQVAQQLDAMRQMLARLQQENAAATAAAARA
ncbi:MAG: hypothetical protein RI884_1105, partial [Pseudomonadota bacterium]